MLKRKLAALLAGAMVLTSLPMVSFARTDNNISYMPTVKKDDTIFTIADAPTITIEEKEDDFGTDKQTFTLKFEGAEWEGDNSGTWQGQSVATFTYTKLSKSLVQIDFTGTGGITADKFVIPLLTKVTADGEAKVTVDSKNSKVSAGTYVFANGGSGSTKTTIADTADFPDELNLETIIIDELKAMSMPHNTPMLNTDSNGNLIGDKKIKLTAPRGFEWVATANSYVTLTGAGAFDSNVFERAEVFPTYGGGQQDKEVLEIYYDNSTGNVSTIGTVLLKDLKLVATEDADFGDVNVEVSGDDISTESIKVGTYVEYGVKITVEDDTKELVSGRYYNADADDDYKLLKLTIEEGVVDSWWTQRNTTIEFPKGIKVRQAKIHADTDKVSDLESINNSGADDIANGTNIDTAYFKLNKDRDIITLSNFNVPVATDKAKVVLEIWVSIEADFDGDITAVVGGPALPEDTEVTLGKAFVAVGAAFDATEMQIGYKEVAVGDIQITESKAGALQRAKELRVRPEMMAFDDDFDLEVEVTEGDLQIGDYDIEDGVLVIDIKRESKEASTITISGAGVYVSRALAEGSYDLEVYGDAFLQNYDKPIKDENPDIASTQPEEGFKTSVLAFEDFIKVVTPAPHKGEAGGAAVTASFTAGSVDYTVGSEVAAADATPYIDANGRMMVPVKYVAYALGIDPQQVQWDQASKTATIYGDKVINITIGSKELVVGGTAVPMDTEAVVKDGRTFIPIAFAARALGVPYSFDNATKTVTFN